MKIDIQTGTMRHMDKGSKVKSRAPRMPKTTATLMRQAVTKPGPKTHLKAESHVKMQAMTSQPANLLPVKPSVSRLNPLRVKRSKEINQSQLISHFSQVTSDIGATPIKQISEPAKPTPKVSNTADKIAPIYPEAKANHAANKPSTAQLLEQAITKASSHNEHISKQKLPAHKRKLHVAGATALVLLVIGLVGYQQLPNLRLGMASAKAGFAGSMPKDLPSGYSLSGLSYDSGMIVSSYHSNSDNRAYTIVQKATNWDGQGLRDNYVRLSYPNFQSILNGDKTIYLYGNQNATWIDKGIWYQVQSDGALSDRQLLQMAS